MISGAAGSLAVVVSFASISWTKISKKTFDFDVVVVVVLLRTRFKCWKAAGMGKELERVLRIVETFFGSEVTVRKGTVLVGSNGMTVRTCVMVV